MFEGRLFTKLTTSLGNVKASDFIGDLVTLFEDGKVLAYDKFTESSIYLRIGSIDLTVSGGSGNLVRVDLTIDNCDLLENFNNLVNIFNKVLTQKSVARAEVKYVELVSGFETYIPLTTSLTIKSTRISKVLSSYGILIKDIISEPINDTQLVSVTGSYVVSGLGIVNVVYTAIVRNYSVRSSLSMGKRVSKQDVKEELIKKLVYESYILSQIINEELYTKYNY
ncbi:MAG: hypothetical protein LM560_05315 [Desulfurococcaceae archaeon]|jgi:hypothetical protein|nr:hypothetical protein [Desulfurococcaceae archaeon]